MSQPAPNQFTSPVSDIVSVLEKKGALDKRAVEAIRRSGSTFIKLHELLLQNHYVDPKTLAEAYAESYKFGQVSLKGKDIPPETLRRISADVAHKYRMVVYEAHGQQLGIAIANPSQLNQDLSEVLEEIRQKHGFEIHLAITTDAEIDEALKGYAPKTAAAQTRPVAGTVNLLNVTIPYNILAKFPAEIAAKYQMVVFAQPSPKHIKVAALNPTNQKTLELLDFIERKHTLQIQLHQATKEGIQHCLSGYTDGKGVQPVSAPESKKIQEKPAEEKKATDQKKDAEPKKVDDNILSVKTAEVSSVSTALGATKSDVEGLEAHDLGSFLKENLSSPEDLAKIIRQGFIPQTVAAIIALAIMQLASDIHIEPLKEYLRLRYRVDGILREILRMPVELHAPIISRIKIMAKLKIDEQRIPQDGRIDVKYQKREADLRVSTLPTIHGEKIVMRILDKSVGIITLEKLGMQGESFKRVLRNIDKPYGIILSTGPTGSGKSTTLYSILNRISTPKVNIITLEDPVEYEIPGVNQTQVKPKIGFSFAEGLRSVLRQDPNIIMVGEIRDGETAQMATHSALTGHLVLSTLHTNDAAGALPRLINMGVEPFLITTSINAIIAQRLVRKICEHCKTQIDVPKPVVDDLLKVLGELKHPEPKFFRGKGCDQCNEGYLGRVGIFEVLEMTEAVEQLAVSRAPASKIAETAIKEGMITMKQDGIIKVFEGVTTLDEVLRVTQSD